MLGSIPYVVPLGIWVDEKLEMRWKYWRRMNRISNYNSKYLCWIYHICIPVNKINATIKHMYSFLMGSIKMESHSKFIFEWITSTYEWIGWALHSPPAMVRYGYKIWSIHLFIGGQHNIYRVQADHGDLVILWTSGGPLFEQGFTLIAAWISNHMAGKS